jgi:hypothetical protein
MPYPFSGTAIDVKTLAFTWLAFSGRRTDKLNLEILAKHLNIEPEGRVPPGHHRRQSHSPGHEGDLESAPRSLLSHPGYQKGVANYQLSPKD